MINGGSNCCVLNVIPTMTVKPFLSSIVWDVPIFFTLSGQHNFFAFVKPDKVWPALIKTWYLYCLYVAGTQAAPTSSKWHQSTNIFWDMYSTQYITFDFRAARRNCWWVVFWPYEDLSIASNNFPQKNAAWLIASDTPWILECQYSNAN